MTMLIFVKEKYNLEFRISAYNQIIKAQYKLLY